MYDFITLEKDQTLEPRVLNLHDLELLLKWEYQQMGTMEEHAQMLAGWSAPWRQESLEHYLPKGWSFGLFQNEQLHGYFLAQPILFVRGLTQTLWVEHIAGLTFETVMECVDISVRVARDKHLQVALLRWQNHKEMEFEQLSQRFRLRKVAEDLLEIPTSKIQL